MTLYITIALAWLASLVVTYVVAKNVVARKIEGAKTKPETEKERPPEKTFRRKRRERLPTPAGWQTSAFLRITYVDYDDNESTRDIDVLSVEEKSKRIHAYCYKGDGIRTFLLKGIVSATDLETGEIIDKIVPFLQNRRMSEDHSRE